MALEKDKKDKLIEVIDREILNECPRSIPKPAKYKKFRKNDEDLPDIEVNKRVVMRVTESGNIKGYLLGIIVDFMVEGEGCWDRSTGLILYTINNTNVDLDKHLGRLVHTTYSSSSHYMFGGIYVVNSFDSKGYKWTRKLSFKDATHEQR